MASGLTISPVISLFLALTPADKPASPPSGLQRIPLRPERPSLGDFTNLWNFLGYEPSTRTVTPASPLGLPPPPMFSTSFPPPEAETSSVLDTDVAGSRSPLSEVSSAISTSSGPEPKKVKFAQKPSLSSPHTTKQRRQAPRQAQGAKGIITVAIGNGQVTWEGRPVIEASTTRRAILVKKLSRLFPNDYSTTTQNKPRHVHVFIDNSNILISFTKFIRSKKHHKKSYKKCQQVLKKPAFSFFHLSLILERARPVARRVLVGSHPRTSVIDEAESLYYKCDLLEKIQKGSSSSGSESSHVEKKVRMVRKEQAVDEVLNYKMCESLIDYDEPGTLVLASGDGAVGEFSAGFFVTVERALKKGWNVELVTFSPNVSKSYVNKDFRQCWKDQFSIIYLDQFVEELLG